MKSLKVTNLSLVGSFKFELGILLALIPGTICIILAVMCCGVSELLIQGDIVKRIVMWFLFVIGPLIFLFFLPSLCVYKVFGSHEFQVVRYGELKHTIFLFNKKIIERKYENITKVAMVEGRETSYATGGFGERSGTTLVIIPSEIYVVSNKESKTLIKTFNAKMATDISGFLKESLLHSGIGE